MKKMFLRNLSGIIIVGMVLSLLVNYYLQIKLSQRDMADSSKILFGQIRQILYENKLEAEKVTEEFQDTCLARAEAAAYIVERNPSIVESQKEMKRIAELLQVDEVHVFDKTGTIYAGSEPKYFGYHFRSGEQMEFFLPMLEDKMSKLCQPITPNTAEGKLMQYAAVWREDGEGIVQIGMEPDKVMQATAKNELSYIFSLFTEGEGAELYAADSKTYEILGSTNKYDVGKRLSNIGVGAEHLTSDENRFHASINGKTSYCIFTKQDHIILGRVCAAVGMYDGVNENTFLLVIYLLGTAIVITWSISRSLDRKIIRGIDDINGKLQNITNGNLDEKVEVCTTPEFKELSGHINQMVKSLLGMTDKLSYVLDKAQMPIGVYEYSRGMERVMFTSKIPEILALPESEKDKLEMNYRLFERKLEEIRRYPVNEEAVFKVPGKEERYVQMESFVRESSMVGILIDVTKDFNEKRLIEQERDEDLLTGLYNRRAFYTHLEALFRKKCELEQAVLIAVDMDNLKTVNDCSGHEAGDSYLRGMAGVLGSVRAPKQLCARLGGDEFAIVIYGCESEEEQQKYVQELRKKQENKDIVYHEGMSFPVEFSMGCAYYPRDGEDYQLLMKSADRRMYEEKRRRKQERKAKGEENGK